MNNILLLSFLSALVMVSAGDLSAASALEGTWCARQEGLTLRFVKDSIFVTSTKKEGVNGWGNFTLDDTLFTTTMIINDVTLVMGYRYIREQKNIIRAKIVFFTVDEDTVPTPDRWMRMERCEVKKKSDVKPDTTE